MREDNNAYSPYTRESSETSGYVRKKPEYDKDLLWRNRKKYLGHKRCLGYLYTVDIVVGLIAANIVRGSLSGIASDPYGAFSLLIILGLVAASVITVTCLENPKVITIAMIIFAACGVLLCFLFNFLYLMFFFFYGGQMLISLILAKNLAYLKTQFGYPYFNESIVESQMYSNKNL